MYTEILDLRMVIKINKAYFQHRYFYTVRVHRCVKLLIFFSINNFILVWYCHCWNHDFNLIHTHLFRYFLSWTSKRFGPYKMELWLSLVEKLIEPRLNFQRKWTAYLWTKLWHRRFSAHYFRTNFYYLDSTFLSYLM